ncbi:Variant SH3 domain containing protein [Trichomonas vaginalis G3]|uniref:Variant SH3 domain containing protein n=1 Tax=Trichomonas vaginalis (strain ATCC PRA-98 / G3) TaxID=412133 RepID=A2E703_TRIV3|nr:BAR/IMD domain-like family [Trichomonas vaginalis G3]EAY11521.1 Variant SH3 domain containing protein [Trichomonas vaginalis G3]KAI5489405.1 BAR/IMD domain-like family [Trichomonas vaginalis G3]|eukprot:XP_001323744.1 Variant SH3 domain containing protein [Trichomonas vaginalis G3]
MSTNLDLFELGTKLEQVINDDIAGISIFNNYLQKRVDLEEMFTQEISNFLNSDMKTNSLSMTLILDEMNALLKHHKEIAENLRQQFMPPIRSFLQYIVREQNAFRNSLLAINDSVKSVNKKLNIAKSQLDKANLDVLHYSAARGDKSRRTVKELENDLEKIKKEQEDTIKNIQEVQYPRLMDNISELDFSVRTTIKNSIINFVHNEISVSEKSLDALKTVAISAERYEPAAETQKIAKALGFGSKQKSIFAIALCNFDGADDTDLPLYRGQLVEIIRQHPSGWWEGEAGGRKGLFPMTFVEPLVDISNGALIVEENFEVDKKWDAQNPGQISLDFGDIVHVYSIFNDMCNGYNIANGQHGLFPTKVIKFVKNFRL